eukprot:m51a1_g5471 hypothetical protein (715) ;mRNA; r:282221-284437
MVSFRVLLVVLVALSIWIPTVIIVGVSQTRTNSLLDGATRLRSPPLAARLRDIVSGSLERAEITTHLNVQDMRTGTPLDFDTPEGLVEARRRMTVQLESIPNATSTIWATTADGRLFGRYAYTSGEVGWWETCANGTLLDYKFDPATLQVGSLNAASYVNNTDQPFYKLAVEKGSCWTNPYTWAGLQYLTYSSLASTKDNPFWGMWGADFLLRDTAMVFQGVTIPNGIALLIEASSENVLATTDPEVSVEKDGEPIRIQDIRGSSWIKAACRHVRSNFGSWSELDQTIDDSETTEPISIGSGVIMTVAKVRRSCLVWSVAVIVEVNKVTVEWTSLLTAAITTVASIGMSITAAMLITRPLIRLTHQMEDIAKLKFDNEVVALSRLSEFEKLEIIFSRLRLGIIAMTKYIPRPVVRDLLLSKLPSGDLQEKQIQSSDNLSLLGMTPRELTVMFTDIKGFTSLSEVLSKRIIVEMLNAWLEAFTSCIHEHQGVVDKYIGDCIMAIWNAPDPVRDHAALACHTALQFRAVLDKLNKTWQEQGLPDLDVRVGIHTGEMLIGNIGCAERINYTVCGTPANIAARVEQLGKAYGVTPLITGDLHDLVKDEFCCVWLDNVVLQGHKTIVTPVYHLVAPTGKATQEQVEMASAMRVLADKWSHRSKFDHINEAIEEAQRADVSGVYKDVFPILRNRSDKRIPASDSFKVIPSGRRSARPMYN